MVCAHLLVNSINPQNWFFCFFEGNGPSGICLSYLLSGYKPYLDTAAAHPNPILYRKLQETKHLPITEQVKTSWNNFFKKMYLI